MGPLAHEKFDVADDLDTRRLRLDDDPVRIGMCQRHAGREHKRIEAGHIGRHKVFELETGGARLFAAGAMIVPYADIRSASDKRLRADKAGSTETEDSDAFAGKVGYWRHYYRNFNVESPMRARTKAMIQNRTTTCGSDQPSCSK